MIEYKLVFTVSGKSAQQLQTIKDEAKQLIFCQKRSILVLHYTAYST